MTARNMGPGLVRADNNLFQVASRHNLKGVISPSRILLAASRLAAVHLAARPPGRRCEIENGPP